MNKKKINVKKAFFRISLIIIILLAIIILLFKLLISPYKSIHNDSKRYKNGPCLVFYPDNRELRNYAKDICANKEKNLYDYALVPYGDYYLVTYSNGTKFFVDKNNNPLKIDKLSNECKPILSDYLRYDMQKDEIDEAFTSKFLEETYYKNLDISNIKIELKGTDMFIYFEQYDRTITVPLVYLQRYLGINLGEGNNKYIRPHYVSPNRKVCVLTFNDGPSIKYSTPIIDELYKYGGSATFFVRGDRINQEAVNMFEKSIEYGNTYGSLTEHYKNLTQIENDDEVIEEIMSPSNVLSQGYKDDIYDIKPINYNMKYYRPPFGLRDKRIDNLSPLKGILWDVDSKDYLYESEDQLFDFFNNLDESDSIDQRIILLHDTYEITSNGICKIIKDYTDKGYQFINIQEYLELTNFDYTKAYR